jgi:3-methyladenine DNA glycosylase AlkD
LFTQQFVRANAARNPTSNAYGARAGTDFEHLRFAAMSELAARIDQRLRSLGTPERAEHEKRYLKSDLKFYGATVWAVRRAAREELAAESDIDGTQLLAAVEALWSRPVHECRAAAVELLASRVDLLEPRDLQLIERLIRESRTWALVDALAPSVAGPLVERHPELASTLDRWAVDHDFWVRRAALLALLLPLRRGDGDFGRFGRYADAMLEEREFFIRKAIGWVLRDTSKKRPELVYEWIRPRAGRASGVTVREAVKYVSEEQRETVLAARKAV